MGLEENTTNDNNEENMNQNEMSKDERIGFHKGSINTLIAERNELLKMVKITEQLVNAHAEELKKLGVELK